MAWVTNILHAVSVISLPAIPPSLAADVVHVRYDVPVEVGSEGAHAQELHEGAMLDLPARVVRRGSAGELWPPVRRRRWCRHGCRRMPLLQPRARCCCIHSDDPERIERGVVVHEVWEAHVCARA